MRLLGIRTRRKTVREESQREEILARHWRNDKYTRTHKGFEPVVRFYQRTVDTIEISSQQQCRRFHYPSIPEINMVGKINLNIPWVIDFGATKHITHEGSIIRCFTSTKNNIPVKIANGDVVPVQCMCNINLPNGLNSECVLHVLNFQGNLLSVGQLTKDLDCVLTFFPDFCTM